MRTYDELKSLIEKRGVHTVFGEPGEGWFVEQNSHELATFLVAMQELGVQSVLEIGTGWRAGLARFLANDMGWRVVSMDKNQPVSPAPNVQFFMGRSEILRPLFDGQTFDLVIIDADHSYEAVKRDHEMYTELATKVVMFHDIAGLRDCEGAAKFWNEFKAKWSKDANEIIADSDQRSGIGWYKRPVFKGPLTEEEIKAHMTVYPDDLDDAVHSPVVVGYKELMPDGTVKTTYEPAPVEDELTYEEMTAPEPPKKKPRKRKPKAQ